MSRIYDDQPLQAIPLTDFKWTGQWKPEKWQRCQVTFSVNSSGNGVILEGDIRGRSRHVIIDASQNKVRYYVLHVKPQRSHRRHFDATGKENEPNFSETGKIRTGHLHSSYKVTSKGESDLLSASELSNLLIHAELIAVSEKWQQPDCLALWIEETQLDKMELASGNVVRLKTKGNGPFIESLAKLDVQSSTVANYAGGEMVGASWTDKVMMVKAQEEDKSLPQDHNEGVDDDEWDD